MSRYSKIYINAETGKWVTLSSGHFSNVVSEIYSENGTNNSTWVIQHDKNTKEFVLDVEDSAGNKIIPNEIEIVDFNTISISFSENQQGRVLIMFF